MSTTAAPSRSRLRVLSAAWQDRARVVAALISAVTLWYLIGQRIVVSSDELKLRVSSANQGEEVSAAGLYLMLPDNLVMVSVEPPEVALKVAGTREDVATINATAGRFVGYYDVPRGFCGDAPQRSLDIRVSEAFRFPAVEARPNLSFSNEDVIITVTIARRDSVVQLLTIDNLDLGSADRQGMRADFRPRARVEVSGPSHVMAILRADPSRLRIDVLGDLSLDDVLSGSTQLPVRDLYVLEGGHPLGQGLLSIRGPEIEVVLTKLREYRDVRLLQHEVLTLVPSRARRANVDWQDPFKVEPAAVDVVMKVPEEYFARGHTEADLRRDLSLYVNLGEREPTLDAGALKVHFVGVPDHAELAITPAEVEVAWQFLERE